MENNLREIRRKRGLTVTELGAAVGFTPSRIREVEAGDVDPKISTCHRFAYALGVAVEDIWPFHPDLDPLATRRRSDGDG